MHKNLMQIVHDIRDISHVALAQLKPGAMGLRALFFTDIAKNMDPRVQVVLDQYFKSVALSPGGELKWELKNGVIAQTAVEELDRVNEAVYKKTLRPTDYIANVTEGYDKKGAPRAGQAVFGVPGSQEKNHWQMEALLQHLGMSLSSRYNSLVSLNVKLALTGEHPLENGRGIRDASGVLYAFDGSLCADDRDKYRRDAEPRLLALGSQN